MQPRPPIDREIRIAIAVGLVSILGLTWIFLTSDLRESFIPPTAAPTAIPLDVNSLETEISSFFPSATSTLEELPPTATGTSPASYPGPTDETLASASTLTAESRPVPSGTSRPDQVALLTAGKYDDMDPNIAYDRYWTVLKNPGTANSYKGTIHVSTGKGNEASFYFTGQRLHLGYQRGKNFGIVTVMIDDQTYGFHEQAGGNVWRSPELSPGTHFVRVIHESGESINLDYIVVLD